MVGRSEICLISGIYISEETVGVFCVFVVVNSPIGIVKISTERVLLINVAVYMAGDTCQIVACGRSVNSSQQSVSGRYRLVNRSRDVVSCKTGCEVIRQFRFGALLSRCYLSMPVLGIIPSWCVFPRETEYELFSSVCATFSELLQVIPVSKNSFVLS